MSVGLVTLLAVPAQAFRTFADETFCIDNGCTDQDVVQRTRPIPFEVNQSGSDDLSLSDAEGVVSDAYGAWTDPACTALEVAYGGTTSAGWVYGDGHSVTTWIESGWTSVHGYASSTLGVTTQHLTNDGSGWIIATADIELNGDDFTWTRGVSRPREGVVGVDVLTHEAGHALGIMHPCEYGALYNAPECETYRDTIDIVPIMWPRNRVSARSLTADDEAAVCYLYPAPRCPDVACPSGTRCDVPTGQCLATGCPGVPCSATSDCIEGLCRPRDSGVAVRDGGSAVYDGGGDVGGGGTPPARTSDGCSCDAPGGPGRHHGPFTLGTLVLLALLGRRHRRA